MVNSVREDFPLVLLGNVACGDTTPCVKSLRSSYTGLYPRDVFALAWYSLSRFRHCRCQANMAYVRQSKPDSALARAILSAKVFEPVQVVSISLGSGCTSHALQIPLWRLAGALGGVTPLVPWARRGSTVEAVGGGRGQCEFSKSWGGVEISVSFQSVETPTSKHQSIKACMHQIMRASHHTFANVGGSRLV